MRPARYARHFSPRAKGEALLLPRIRTLGDPDEEAAIIFGAEDGLDGDGATGAAAIGALPRRLALMRLVLALGHGAVRGATEAEIESVRFVHSPGQASYLAADLARLMDLVEVGGGQSRKSGWARDRTISPFTGRPRSSSSRSSPSIGRFILPTIGWCRRSPAATR